jgi:alpha-1,2-mannosyltransferase
MPPLPSPKALLLVLVLLLYVPFVGKTAKHSLHGPADFATFHAASGMAFDDGKSPYAPGAFAGAEAALGTPVFPYVYPPPSLLAFYPLTFFTYPTARFVIFALNQALLLASCYLLLRKLVPVDLNRAADAMTAAFFCVYVLSYQPIAFELSHGQVDLLVLTCICLTWLAVERAKPAFLIALPLSFAILVKTYPLAFLPLLLIHRKVRALFYVAGLLMLYTAAAYIVLPGSVWADYAINVLPTAGYGRTPYNLGSPAFPWNQSVNGFTARLFAPNDMSQVLWPNESLARIVPYVLALGIIAVTVGASYLASRSRPAQSTLASEFSLYLLMMFMVSPIAWVQHLVFALPAALVSLRVVTAERPEPRLLVVIAGALLLLAWPLPIELPALRSGPLTLAVSAKLYAAAILWGFLLLTLLQPSRAKPSLARPAE